jgi:hypothetical protein
MKYTHILLLLAAVTLGACFNTRFDDTEQKRLQRIRDSIHTDSVNMRRNTPDTTLAIYKRTAFCDTVQVVVFDRVKMLSGDKAAEYAKRHKQYGSNLSLIVNQKVTLETLAMDSLATILLLDNGVNNIRRPIVTDTVDGEALKYRRCEISDIAEGLTAEELMEIIVLHRSIVYLRQLPHRE